jgi:hypothetical protein
MMKKTVLLTVVLAVAALSMAAANEFRMGLTGSLEINANPFDEDSYKGMERLFPGLYWEFIMNHVGIGMTTLVRFRSTDAVAPAVGKVWEVLWIGSFDLRYHFIKESFIDPFAEVDIGCAGDVVLPECDHDGDVINGGRLKSISLFGAVGGGVAVRLEMFRVGVRVLYRFFNDGVPGTQFDVTPVSTFETAIFVGIGF